MTLINEGGMYRLIMRSDMPQADEFQDWVTDEVLPAIRQTGRYEIIPSAPAPRQVDINVEHALALRAQQDQLDEVRGDVTEVRGDVAQLNTRMANLEKRDADGVEWFRALGYSRLVGLPTAPSQVQSLGTRAANICRRANVTPDWTGHSEWGRVGVYPRWALDQAVKEAQPTTMDPDDAITDAIQKLRRKGKRDPIQGQMNMFEAAPEDEPF